MRRRKITIRSVAIRGETIRGEGIGGDAIRNEAIPSEANRNAASFNDGGSVPDLAASVRKSIMQRQKKIWRGAIPCNRCGPAMPRDNMTRQSGPSILP